LEPSIEMCPSLTNPAFWQSPQHLHEQASERAEMQLAEVRDRIVIGVAVACQHAEANVLVRRPLNTPR